MATTIDIKTILTGVVTAALISTGSFVWFMGGIENRIGVLEKDSSKVDQILMTVNTMKEQMAVMNTDITYVKENLRDLKTNSNSLNEDVRNLRTSISDLQRYNPPGAQNGRQ